MCIQDVRDKHILKDTVKSLTAFSHRYDKVEDSKELNP